MGVSIFFDPAGGPWNPRSAPKPSHLSIAALRWAACHPPVKYTDKQGQYLAFIYYYTKIHGIGPAESEMQRYFDVTPPAFIR